MKKNSEQPSFEALLQDLEDTVSLLESGDLSLEEALQTFERGITLSNLCHMRLKEVEDKIKVLSRGENGQTIFSELDLEGDKN